MMACTGHSLAQANNTVCETDGFEQLSVKDLDSLLLGEWEYKYSFMNDTCFHIENLGDIPRSFSFEKASITVLKSEYPKLYSFGQGRLLFGLTCSHEKKPFGETTYPIVDTVARDSTMVRVTHYVEGNGVGKGYSYFLESVDQEQLVLRNERQYHVGAKEVTGLRHVYVRKQN